MTMTDAKIIWAKTILRDSDQYVAFRKPFTTTENGTVTLDIYADTYYNLYIDGTFIHRGPVRRHETAAQYDRITLDLDQGTHIIAVLVHHIGLEHAAHRKGMPTLWCVGEGAGCAFVSDQTWKAQFSNAFLDNDGLFGCYDFRENIDFRRFSPDWNTLRFDDSAWECADVLGVPGSEADVHKNYTRRRMKHFSYIINEANILERGTYFETADADEFFYSRFMRRNRTDADTASDGSFVVAGFDCTLSGTAIIEYTGAAAGDELILAYDDRFDDGECRMPVFGACFSYSDRFFLPAGDGKVEVFFPRGFRYVWADLSGKGQIKAVSARREVYPYLPKSIATSSTFLDNLYAQSIRTQHICTIDGYTDCINRERVLWLGDAWIDTMSAYFAEVDTGLLLTTMYEHALGRQESGAIGGYNSSDLQPEWLTIASYNMMYLHMLCDYITYTDCAEDILPLKEIARGILDNIRTGWNENGVFDSTVRDGGNYWDWGYADARGQSLKTNAFYIYTVERMATYDFFADVVGDFTVELDRMRKTCFHLFWDEERRVFHDGWEVGKERNPLSTQLANALAVLSGICPTALRDEVLERIVDPAELDEIPLGENQDNEDRVPDTTKILPSGTMYSAMIVAIAMFEAGRNDLALAYMEEVWGPFADLPTLPELRRNGRSSTMCHGWSGGAGYLIPRYLLGVTPCEYGWKAAQLHPSADVISHAEGRIPTPMGDLTVQWYRMGDALKVAAILPGDMTLTVHWADRETVLRESGEIVIL